MDDPLLHGLNDAQAAAVSSLEGPLLVLAGPGSGKTRVITHRIANLLRNGVSARQIVALTFTNKAAQEMRLRVERLAPGEPVWASTFHRFCARMLRQYGQYVGLSDGYTIYDTYDSKQALSRTLDALGVTSSHYSPDRVGSAISRAKNNLVTAAEFTPRAGNPLDRILLEVYPAYQQRLLSSNAVDFDDLLLHVATMLRDQPELRSQLDDRYRYLLVDEYQDTNLAQYAIIRALSLDHPNLCVTGDPDQSIYGWRGANLGNILDFEKDYPRVKVVKLERNYRSTKAILRVADQLISYNVRRKQKSLFTENVEGDAVRLVRHGDNASEAESIALRIVSDVRAGRRRPRDYAIFYRMNALSREVEKALRLHGVPYQMVNGLEFYQRKEIKDALAYLRLLNNPRDEVALLRVVNVPPRGIGKSTLERLGMFAAEHGVPLLETCRKAGLVPGVPKRSAVAVAKFVHMLDRLAALHSDSVEEILGHVLTESGYRQLLEESDEEEDQERLANIEELLTAARQFDEQNPGVSSLDGFLEESSLVADTDAFEADDDRVTLMTLHAAKGLEFPCVFLIALEQGILPHERSRDNLEELEEERRLMFVGITRAKEELELSLAAYRDFRGQRRLTVPSPFLMELPREQMQTVGLGQPQMIRQNEPDDVHDDFPDEDWRQDIPDERPVAKPMSNPYLVAATITPLATAAELESQTIDEGPQLPPDAFKLGMIVRHYQYGLGKITSLSGSGVKRSATVMFASAAGERKFMLAQSPLRPAREEF
jgi:DNA helicase-2/ATP-dependent DNA helicase PcrA